MASQVSLGNLQPSSTFGDFNNLNFLMQSALSKLETATLVQVQACSNDGGVSPFGTVDVLPLVDQVDGNGAPTPHAVLFGLPYLRVQGGANAVIMDPQAGDIGVAVFASRDIGSVKSTQGEAVPGSSRKYHISDGMYLGGMLNAAPTAYVQFNDDGITILTPDDVSVQGDNVALQADEAATLGGDSLTLTGSSTAKLTAPSVEVGSSGGSYQALATQALVTWITSALIPALAAHAITVAAPPANSVTTATAAS